MGQSLELFFIDGTPEGMLTAEVFNWTGHILSTPRIRLADALRRKEASYTGVYILLGEDGKNSSTKIYIGESDDVAVRIRNHDAKKDWWTQAVLITSAANSLNKAHVRYLEARLIEEAHRAGRMSIENSTRPETPLLSEASISNMEQFLTYIFTALPALRIDGFLVKTRARERVEPLVSASALSITFQLKLANEEVDASAKLNKDEFVVQAGSRGRADWIGVQHNYQRLFDEVVSSGVYERQGTHRVFRQAYVFASPSAAGAVLTGRATAGPKAWVLAANPTKTYKEWEAEQLSQANLKEL